MRSYSGNESFWICLENTDNACELLENKAAFIVCGELMRFETFTIFSMYVCSGNNKCMHCPQITTLCSLVERSTAIL
jgi:hypothetical protein